MAEERLDELTVSQLRERASELEVDGRSSMSKSELVEAVGEAESSSSSAPDTSQESSSNETTSGSSGEKRSGDGIKPASEISAPSIGPNTVIEHTPPEERLDHDKISDVDAMGLDKRRSVVGHSYSASFGKQLLLYGIFLVVLGAVLFGGKMLADELDAPPAEYADEAPWSKPEGASNAGPAPIQ